MYRLDDGAARLSGEAEQGVARPQALHQARVSEENQAPDQAQRAQAATKEEANLLWDYLALVAGFNSNASPEAPWRVYPGSPFLMHALMTEPGRAAVHDRLKLFELHPTDSQALAAHVAQLEAGRQVSVARQDGFEGLERPAAPAGRPRQARAGRWC